MFDKMIDQMKETFEPLTMKKGKIKKGSKVLTKEDIEKDIIYNLSKSKIEYDESEFAEWFNKFFAVLEDNDKDSQVKKSKGDEKQEAIHRILEENKDLIPLRVNYPRSTTETIFLVISDFENHVIEPITTTTDRTKWVNYFLSNKTLNSFVIGLQDILKGEGLRISITEIANEVIKFVIDFNTIYFMVDEFKTFSFDKAVWKVSYLDLDLIQNSDGNISAWESWRKAIDNEEGFNLFCAWIWGIFDEVCIENNRQALWIYGEGMDGKSTVTNVIQYIISGEYQKNYGSKTISTDLLSKSFWASDIFGNNLTIVNEVTDPNVIHSKEFQSKFHAWLGGDNCAIEGKNKGSFSARLYSKCMIHANIKPEFSGYINVNTRCIPVQIKNTYFKGLEYGKKYSELTDVYDWKKSLYEQRYSFLKYCKTQFEELYTTQHLFKISKDYQDQFLEKDEKHANIDSLMEKLSTNPSTSVYYSAENMNACIKFIAKAGYNMNISNRDISAIYKKLDIEKPRIIVNGVRKWVRMMTIDRTWLEAYNEDVDKRNHGNEDLKLKSLKEDEKKKNTRFDGMIGFD